MFGFFEMVFAFLTRQLGTRGDAADANGSALARLREIVQKGIIVKYTVPSMNVKFSNDTPVQFTSSTPEGPLKTFRLDRMPFVNPMKVRLRSTVYNSTAVSGTSTYFRIRKNGEVILEKQGFQAGTETFDLDITIDIGDEITLEARRGTTAGYGELRQFRIMYDVIESTEINGTMS